MTQTLARIKQAGKNFEILVNLENALKFKRGEIDTIEAEGDKIFSDSKKGMVASSSDLKQAFGTFDINTIVEKIVKSGEVQTTQEHRSAEQEKKLKQIIDFLVMNTVDPKTGNPHTSQRIETALKEAHINIKNIPVEAQVNEILNSIRSILPIKVKSKRVKINIPAMHTGKAYGVVSQYKEDEKWLDDGSLQIIVNVPSGMIMDFYDKLNGVTHGSALTEEIKEE